MSVQHDLYAYSCILAEDDSVETSLLPSLQRNGYDLKREKEKDIGKTNEMAIVAIRSLGSSGSALNLKKFKRETQDRR
jgi:hypothetical protein